jgi:hypothetical protein
VRTTASTPPTKSDLVRHTSKATVGSKIKKEHTSSGCVLLGLTNFCLCGTIILRRKLNKTLHRDKHGITKRRLLYEVYSALDRCQILSGWNNLGISSNRPRKYPARLRKLPWLFRAAIFRQLQAIPSLGERSLGVPNHPLLQKKAERARLFRQWWH